MNGFLNPEGVLYECAPYEHLDKASEIVANMGVTVITRLDAEKHLQEQGWIVIRDTDVYGLIGYYMDNKEERLHLTDAQKGFLNNLYGKVNGDCQRSIDFLFEMDK